MKNAHNNFQEPKAMSSNFFFCPKNCPKTQTLLIYCNKLQGEATTHSKLHSKYECRELQRESLTLSVKNAQKAQIRLMRSVAVCVGGLEEGHKEQNINNSGAYSRLDCLHDIIICAV